MVFQSAPTSKEIADTTNIFLWRQYETYLTEFYQ